jgi:hypothetical protein
MSDEQYGQYEERGEKEEKEEEEKQEKSWDEKWRRDPLSAAVWALILIWAGLVLLGANIGLLAGSFLDAWPIFFLGAGALLLLEVGFRLLVPAYRRPLTGNLILALVFFGIGLGGLISWALLWPFIIIIVGVYILFSGLLRRRD